MLSIWLNPNFTEKGVNLFNLSQATQGLLKWYCTWVSLGRTFSFHAVLQFKHRTSSHFKRNAFTVFISFKCIKSICVWFSENLMNAVIESLTALNSIFKLQPSSIQSHSLGETISFLILSLLLKDPHQAKPIYKHIYTLLFIGKNRNKMWTSLLYKALLLK